MTLRILTVDDSKTIRQMLAGAFKPFRCEVLEACNGVEGLAVAKAFNPDIIILDYTMPVMDGSEMLTRLKGDPPLRTIPVIMLTAEAGRETVLRFSKAGVKDYLIKPFKRELIIQRVGRIIRLQPREDSTAPPCGSAHPAKRKSEGARANAAHPGLSPHAIVAA